MKLAKLWFSGNEWIIDLILLKTIIKFWAESILRDLMCWPAVKLLEKIRKQKENIEIFLEFKKKIVEFNISWGQLNLNKDYYLNKYWIWPDEYKVIEFILRSDTFESLLYMLQKFDTLLSALIFNFLSQKISIVEYNKEFIEISLLISIYFKSLNSNVFQFFKFEERFIVFCQLFNEILIDFYSVY